MADWISIFLRAAGILLLIWVLLGWILSGRDRGGAAVLACVAGDGPRQEAFVWYWLWLREAGISRLPLILVDCGLSPEERETLAVLIRDRPDAEFCPPEALAQRMRTEALAHGGHGTAAG